MEAIISRKAKDSEIGLARKNLQDTIAYWGTNWNARSLEELPDYVRDQYILYTHVLWLEEQFSLLKEEKKDDDVRNDSPKSIDVSEGNAVEQPTAEDDKGGDSVGTVIHSTGLRRVESETADGAGGTELRPDDPNIHTREELEK